MSRYRKLILLVAALNLAAILAFPPWDQLAIAGPRVPSFAGFHLFTYSAPGHSINQPLLLIEVIVVLVNAGIAWLVSAGTGNADRRTGYLNAALVFVGINLVVIVLFPPFQYVHAVTGAALPSFDGFYFLFNGNPQLTLVSTILYLEVFFVLVNGCLVYLLFRDRSSDPVHGRDLQRIAREIQRSRS